MNGPGDSPRQEVRAESGFAYGVIGADIHVFGDGRPLYLLENWRPPPEADAEFLRELPSRLLNARFAVVDFTGRADELAELREWRQQGPRLAARWLHGPGGQGKTRLAARFAAQTAAAGWKVVTATHGPGSVLPPPGSQDLRLGGAAGLLLIVDYADRWPLSHLTWLLSNAVLHQTRTRTRVLFLARSADAWPAVRASLANQQAGTSTQFLPPLPADGPDHRGSMFDAARDAFAACYDVGSPRDIGPPGSLHGPEFGLTLAVHMAALVAVDARVTGRRPPAAMAGLTLYLLDREQLHWARLYGDAPGGAGLETRKIRTPPEQMNRAVFTAALTGPLEPAAGTAAIARTFPPQTAQQVRDDHAVCYPSAGLTVLEPMYPDRLAEDFLALTLPGHASDYPAQSWAGTTASALLARDHDDRPPAWTSRAVIFLIAAAERWPHVGPGHLYPWLRADPRLAVDAGSAAVSGLAVHPAADLDLLAAVEACLPDGRNADLDPGIADLATRLAQHRLATAQEPGAQAHIHYDLGLRLSNAGLRERALAATEESVAILRRLAETDHGRDRELATALHGLGMDRLALGRRAEALSATREAVEIRRRLVQADRGHESSLANTLHSLAVDLAENGQIDDALPAARESADIYRRLFEASPGEYAHEFAMAMNGLGIRLAAMGYWHEAVDATEVAVDLLRRLSEADPAGYEFTLADALDGLGNRLAELGRYADSLAAAQEAVEMFRRLATANPAAFERELSRCLSNLGGCLSELRRPDEALAANEEAVAVVRRLVAGDPAAHEPELGRCLSNLSGCLSDLRRYDDALAAMREAVSVRRRLAGTNRTAHQHELAISLDGLGIRLSDLGMFAEAHAATSEAVTIWRDLCEQNLAAHEGRLAQALNNLGSDLASLGRHEEALLATREAAAIFQRLGQASPAYAPESAGSLHNLAIRLADLGRYHEAATVSEQAVAQYRRLAAADPAYRDSLAGSRSNLRSYRRRRLVARVAHPRTGHG